MQVIKGANTGHEQLIVKSKSKSNPFALTVVLFSLSFSYLLIHVNKIFAIFFGILLILSTILSSRQIKLQIRKSILMGSIILHFILIICLSLSLHLSSYIDIIAVICFYLSSIGMALFGNIQKNNEKQQQIKKVKSS